ncbi:MAG: thioesterase [Candidatus Aminicenantes bacterium]|nr:thioesterase [Candidatus Aminicenantes bacterium]
MDLIYDQKFFIHTYEIDAEGRAQVLALLNFLQDAAAGHASRLGFSVPDLVKRGLTWVLSRYRVSIQRYPRFFEEVTVKTWPSGLQSYFALRDFEISDAKGPFLAATTSWMLLNLKTKQPVKAEDHLAADMVHPQRSLPDAFPTIPSLAGAVREMKFRVARRDLDMNKHVNNVVYIHWALEAVEDEVAAAKRPVDLEVSYRAEAFYKEDVVSSVGTAEEVEGTVAFLHRIVRASDGTELARLRTRWA